MINEVQSKNVNWVNRPVIKMHDNPPADSQWEYRVWMPDWLAEWDVYGDWEVERFNSMRDSLKQGDVLFDVGAEVGWQSVIYAQLVGPENMVLIEPSYRLWPNIQAIWEKNFPGQPPLQCHYGLFGAITTSNFVLPKHLFPAEADAPLSTKLHYASLEGAGWRMPQIRLDDFVTNTAMIPDALTIDTEGSEILILKGAKNTLLNNNLKVWVSIHPDLSERHYGLSAAELHAFMRHCGYEGEHLATDHEEHWYFRKGRND